VMPLGHNFAHKSDKTQVEVEIVACN